MRSSEWIARLNPALSKKWLLILAGVVWSGVGLMLLRYAITWLTQPISPISLWLGLLGVLISFAINHWMFSGLARKNIERILSLNDKACVFSFQAWKSYFIVIIMMSGGILLRNSAFPKPYLAVMYAAIGGGLFEASLKYYRRYYQVASSN